MSTPVVGLFPDPGRARAAVEALEAAGVARGSISVLARAAAAEEARELAEDTGTDTHVEGAARNSRLQDLLGWVAGVGGLVVPGVGPVLSSGLLAASLRAARAGEGQGTLTGVLVGLGVPEEAAEEDERRLGAGDILVVVHDVDGGRRAAAERILGGARAG